MGRQGSSQSLWGAGAGGYVAGDKLNLSEEFVKGEKI